MTIPSQKQAGRTANGQFRPGVSGNASGNVHRSRHALNADTIREMHAAFRRGGRAAIDKVMKQQPAVFLKLLVLLVPREMRVEHTGGVKSMSDEELERGIEAVQVMLAARDAGSHAKIIEAAGFEAIQISGFGLAGSLLAKPDVGFPRRAWLHVIDTIGIVHAMILRLQALVLPFKVLIGAAH